MPKIPSRILVEVAVDSIEDALHAARIGAARIEMCSRLDLDGLTPLRGDIRELKKQLPPGVGIAAMVRPSPTPFTCDHDDFVRMQRQIGEMLEEGAGGIVFGILDDHSRIDVARCRELLACCGNAESVFHRAFDRTPDPIEALDQLIDLGFTRLLTSGQAASAASPPGIAMLARLVDHARGRIQILPGGGVRAANVLSILNATGCTQAHSSCRITTPKGPRFEPRELASLLSVVRSEVS